MKMEQEKETESRAIVKEIHVASHFQSRLKACLTSFDLQ